MALRFVRRPAGLGSRAFAPDNVPLKDTVRQSGST